MESIVIIINLTRYLCNDRMVRVISMLGKCSHSVQRIFSFNFYIAGILVCPCMLRYALHYDYIQIMPTWMDQICD